MANEQISEIDKPTERPSEDRPSESIKVDDLENRALAFAKRVIGFVNTLEKTIRNKEVGQQPFRSTSSVGANYIEANEALSTKDFLMRAKICRNESRKYVTGSSSLPVKIILNLNVNFY